MRKVTITNTESRETPRQFNQLPDIKVRSPRQRLLDSAAEEIICAEEFSDAVINAATAIAPQLSQDDVEAMMEKYDDKYSNICLEHVSSILSMLSDDNLRIIEGYNNGETSLIEILRIGDILAGGTTRAIQRIATWLVDQERAKWLPAAGQQPQAAEAPRFGLDGQPIPNPQTNG